MNKETLDSNSLKTSIYTIRGTKVMLDRDLSRLHAVTTGNLNKAVKRNIDRFPYDFMFQLSKEEYDSLRFQIGILKQGTHSKYLPYAFTEMGVAMLSSVLNSKTAIDINIKIMRAFVELRQIITTQQEYALLKETVHRIESRMDTVEANHLVDTMLVSGKVKKLSEDVFRLRKDIGHISELFDQFQDARIIIYPFQNETRISNCGGSIFRICNQSNLESLRSRFHFGMGIKRPEDKSNQG